VWLGHADARVDEPPPGCVELAWGHLFVLHPSRGSILLRYVAYFGDEVRATLYHVK